MALISHKLAAATAVAAAFSMTAAPAAAIELPRAAGQQAAKAGTLDAENRRHRGYRGYGDWDDDIDAEDVLVGVLILGGIAAIASAASKPREPAYPEPEPYPGDAGYREPAADGYRSRGMAQAVDTCVAEIEQGGDRIGSVDSVSREADGWRVAGALDGGMEYWCTVDGAGRVSGVGGSGTAYAEPQYGDAYYDRARAAKEGADGSGRVTGIAIGSYGASHEGREGEEAGVYDAELDRALTAMIDSTEIGADGKVVFNAALGDQAFLEPDSGRYWQISGEGQGDFRSRSLWDRTLEVSGRKAWTAPLYYDSNEFAGEPLRVAERTVRLPGSDVEWQFIVARARDTGA